MEHARKMYLVPKELLKLIEEKQSQRVKPLTSKIGKLDQQLESMLNTDALPADEQLKLYNQSAQQWQTYQEKDNQPIPVMLQSNTTSTTDIQAPTKSSSRTVYDSVIESIPKTFQRQAKWLLQRIQNSDHLGWNEQGELIVDGNPVPGTHMVDLINDVVRRRKTSQPMGWRVFSRALNRLNVPQEVVGNKDRWAFMKGQEEDSSSPQSPPSAFFTPKSHTPKGRTPKRSARKSKHQSDPVKWEPYEKL